MGTVLQVPTNLPKARTDAAIIQYHVQLRTAFGILTSMGYITPDLYFIVMAEDHADKQHAQHF